MSQMFAQSQDFSSSSYSAEATHTEMANAIRFLAMDAVEQAKSGHPGMPMGLADVATVLFSQFLKFDAQAPQWWDRDRFILSNGHGSMLLYALLYLTGYQGMTLDEIKHFRQLGSVTPGHPEYGHTIGVETTTGPLGQGLANAVGMAIAERHLRDIWGENHMNHHTYVIVGDGCLMEGISHEALSLAGHLELNRLIVLFDDNHISIDGDTDLSVSDDHLKRLESYGWATNSIDGHDPLAIAQALKTAHQSMKPSFIACRTIIGYGAPTKAGTESAHGSPLGEKEIAAVRENLKWPYPPFEIPDHILASWRKLGARHQKARLDWEKRIQKLPTEKKIDFERLMAGRLPFGWSQPLTAAKKTCIQNKTAQATRLSSQMALNLLAKSVPELIGGSADLTGSNNTKAEGMKVITAEDFKGQYIHYGVREHGMAAIMNGMALHKGVIPYGGTFLTFADYCRPSIRLAALMGIRVIFVMTHDSIGLGEDGPTHQPVEHFAALRAIPNLHVFRPADVVETLECWAAALQSEHTPSVLCLTRQTVPLIRDFNDDENLSAKGAYVVKASSLPEQVTLIGTGSEVQIALEAQKLLEDQGVGARVVSMPCWSLFLEQPDVYQNMVLGQNTVRIAVEAGVAFGWEKFVGCTSNVVGMPGFGASAPCKDLYEYFGITAEKVVEKCLSVIPEARKT